MEVERFLDIIGGDFYTGVPDSLLKPLCDCLYNRYGRSDRHIIAANEGNAAALAAGYHLATGKVPVVYLQNSGEGNIINPTASLLHQQVYAIPALFLVGWRGEPGGQDEPQHIFQGKITLKLLEDLDISTFVLTKETEEEEIRRAMEGFRSLLAAGRSAAFVVKKGALTYPGQAVWHNCHTLSREDAIRAIVEAVGEDPIISTTGKASRELFELREEKGQGHQYDFLTVGSMGHSSSIALGIALQAKDRRIWCLDGDGAALMHMGALAVIGSLQPPNFIHVVLNNEAHESVGGMPTAAGCIDLPGVARACGYLDAVSVTELQDLRNALDQAKKQHRLTFLEVKCSLGSRNNLGRPTSSPLENKQAFMRFLSLPGTRP